MAINTTLPTLEVPLQEVDFRGDYPAIPLPRSARSAAVNALARGQTHYAPVAGIPNLRTVLSEFFARMDIHVAAEQVLVTGGEQESRFLTLQGITPLDTTSILTARGDRQARYLALFNAVHENTRIAIPSVVHPGVG